MWLKLLTSEGLKSALKEMLRKKRKKKKEISKLRISAHEVKTEFIPVFFDLGQEINELI